MKKIIWIPIVIVVIGLVIFAIGYSAGGLKAFWIDRGGFHLEERGDENGNGKLMSVDETYRSFDNIELEADFVDRIEIMEGDGYAVRGQNYERWGGLDVKLEGNTLRIDATDNSRNWRIDFGLDELLGRYRDDSWIEITYPPGAEIEDVMAKISAGGITVKNLDCSSFTIDNSFGDIEASSLTCGSLKFTDAAGRISITRAEVAGDAVIENSFGDVRLADIGADSLSADLDSGEISAENIRANIFSVSNKFGKVDIDGADAENVKLKLDSGNLSADNIDAGDLSVKSSFGEVGLDGLVFTGLCDIKCSSGNVDVGLLMKEDDVSYEIDVSAGDVQVDGRKFNGSVTNRAPGAASLKVKADFGNVNVDFTG